jgi:hypothetical protein
LGAELVLLDGNRDNAGPSRSANTGDAQPTGSSQPPAGSDLDDEIRGACQAGGAV